MLYLYLILFFFRKMPKDHVAKVHLFLNAAKGNSRNIHASLPGFFFNCQMKGDWQSIHT